jgi:hypothetical protein
VATFWGTTEDDDPLLGADERDGIVVALFGADKVAATRAHASHPRPENTLMWDPADISTRDRVEREWSGERGVVDNIDGKHAHVTWDSGAAGWVSLTELRWEEKET